MKKHIELPRLVLNGVFNTECIIEEVSPEKESESVKMNKQIKRQKSGDKSSSISYNSSAIDDENFGNQYYLSPDQKFKLKVNKLPGSAIIEEFQDNESEVDQELLDQFFKRSNNDPTSVTQKSSPKIEELISEKAVIKQRAQTGFMSQRGLRIEEIQHQSTPPEQKHQIFNSVPAGAQEFEVVLSQRLKEEKKIWMNGIRSKLEDELKRKYVIYEEKIQELIQELEKERLLKSNHSTSPPNLHVEYSDNTQESQASRSYAGCEKTQRVFRETFGKQNNSSQFSQPSVASISPKFKSLSQEKEPLNLTSAQVSPALLSTNIGKEHDIQSDKTELKGEEQEDAIPVSDKKQIPGLNKVKEQKYPIQESGYSPKTFATARSSQQSLNIDEIRSILVQVEQLEQELHQKDFQIDQLQKELQELQFSMKTQICKYEEEQKITRNLTEQNQSLSYQLQNLQKEFQEQTVIYERLVNSYLEKDQKIKQLQETLDQFRQRESVCDDGEFQSEIRWVSNSKAPENESNFATRIQNVQITPITKESETEKLLHQLNMLQNQNMSLQEHNIELERQLIELQRDQTDPNNHQLIQMTAEKRKKKLGEDSIQQENLDSEMAMNTQLMLQKIQDLEKMFITEFNTQKEEKSTFSSMAKLKGQNLTQEEIEINNAKKLKALYEIKTVFTDYEEEKEELNIEIMRLKRELSFFDGLKEVMEQQGLKSTDVKLILLKNRRFKEGQKSQSRGKKSEKLFFGAQEQEIPHKVKNRKLTRQIHSERESRESSVTSVINRSQSQQKLNLYMTCGEHEVPKSSSHPYIDRSLNIPKQSISLTNQAPSGRTVRLLHETNQLKQLSETNPQSEIFQEDQETHVHENSISHLHGVSKQCNQEYPPIGATLEFRNSNQQDLIKSFKEQINLMSAQIKNLENDKEFLRREIQVNQRKYLQVVDQMNQQFSEELQLLEQKQGLDSQTKTSSLINQLSQCEEKIATYLEQIELYKRVNDERKAEVLYWRTKFFDDDLVPQEQSTAYLPKNSSLPKKIASKSTFNTQRSYEQNYVKQKPQSRNSSKEDLKECQQIQTQLLKNLLKNQNFDLPFTEQRNQRLGLNRYFSQSVIQNMLKSTQNYSQNQENYGMKNGQDAKGQAQLMQMQKRRSLDFDDQENSEITERKTQRVHSANFFENTLQSNQNHKRKNLKTNSIHDAKFKSGHQTSSSALTRTTQNFLQDKARLPHEGKALPTNHRKSLSNVHKNLADPGYLNNYDPTFRQKPSGGHLRQQFFNTT